MKTHGYFFHTASTRPEDATLLFLLITTGMSSEEAPAPPQMFPRRQSAGFQRTVQMLSLDLPYGKVPFSILYFTVFWCGGTHAIVHKWLEDRLAAAGSLLPLRSRH